MNVHEMEALDMLKLRENILIPYYQRNYNWSRSQCLRLMEDLQALKKEDSSHFFGATVIKDSGIKSVEVIDGQQRITTISLLLLAIYNYVNDNEDVETSYDIDTFKNSYLVDKKKAGQENIKLVPNPNDKPAYDSLFDETIKFNGQSNIIKNYDFFYDYLDKYVESVDDLIESIEKLVLVSIYLSHEDDAQLIFESINSTGLSLTEADKIRNFLFMNESHKTQERIYNNFWTEIEKNTDFKLDDFFKDYITIKSNKIPTTSKLYEKFKELTNYYIEEEDFDKDNYLSDIRDFSFAYYQYNSSNTGTEKIDRILRRLNKLDFTAARVFLMPLLVKFEKNIITAEEFIETAHIIEVYLARRMIAKRASNGLKFVSENLYRDTVNLVQKDPSHTFAEYLSALLLSKKNNTELPRDTELENALRYNDIFGLKTNYRAYIFERLENHNGKEVVDLYDGFESNRYQIEHIMPQTLTPSWKEALGDNWKNVYNKYINNLGNLTVTGYNSEYKNYDFLVKRDMENGYSDSKFKFLNSIPESVDKWTEEEIKARQDQLVQRSLDVWKLPESDIVINEVTYEVVDYDGDASQFTGTKFNGYIFLDDEFVEASDAVKIYMGVIEKLYKENPQPIITVSQSDTKHSRLASNFRTEATNATTELDENIHVITNMSNEGKFETLNDLFEVYDIPSSSLQLSFYDKKEEE